MDPISVKFWIDPELWTNKITPYFEDKCLEMGNSDFDLRVLKVYSGPLVDNIIFEPDVYGGYHLSTNRIYTINLGIKCEIIEGYFGLLTLRSSMGQKGVCQPTPGKIDPSYRGYIYLTVFCPFLPFVAPPTLQFGERIAQITIKKYYKNYQIVNNFNELSITNRGELGHGQYTGKGIVAIREKK